MSWSRQVELMGQSGHFEYTVEKSLDSVFSLLYTVVIADILLDERAYWALTVLYFF